MLCDDITYHVLHLFPLIIRSNKGGLEIFTFSNLDWFNQSVQKRKKLHFVIIVFFYIYISINHIRD